MLELIPTLLSDQAVKPLDVNRPMTALSQLVVKQIDLIAQRKAAIAAPEILTPNLLPTSLVATSSLAAAKTSTSLLVAPANSDSLTGDRATGVDQATASASDNPTSAEATSIPAQTPPSVLPTPAPAGATMASDQLAAAQPENTQLNGATAQPTPAVEMAPTAAPTAVPIVVPPPLSASTPATPPTPAETPTEPTSAASVDRSLAASPTAAPAAAIVPNQTAIAERKKEIEQKLAEIVAKDRQRQSASQKPTQPTTQPPNQEATLVASAIDYAQQGDFERARAILQDPAISTATQTEVLSRIAALQLVETPSLPTPDAATSQASAKSKQIFVPKPEQPSQPATQVLNQEATEIQGLLKQTPSIPHTRPPAARLSPDDTVLRSQQFDLPAPSAPQFAPPGATAQGAGNYTTTPIDGQIATRSPLPGVPGNGNLRLLYPLPTPAPVTSPFGWRVHPVTGQRRLHTGTDIGAAAGTPILAAYSGKVATADQLGGYGLAVVLEHNNGSQDTLYAHMSEILVRPGQWVEQGSVIGRVGSTGMSTGPHLHFELRQKTKDGWQTLDPGPVLQAAKNDLVRALQSAQTLQQPPNRQAAL
jgi:murein DD-endopeptidase MepM/ murein hydrolase activator NlpD